MNNLQPSIYKGDSTKAFGRKFIEVDLEAPEEWDIAAAEFKVGALPSIIFDDPVFPLYIDLDSSQTDLLKDVTACYLALYDREGNKLTCEGSFVFVAKKKVV